MKEKYASYYKKLKCFQDPVENPENEGEQNLVKHALILNKEIAATEGENYTKARRKLMSYLKSGSGRSLLKAVELTQKYQTYYDVHVSPQRSVYPVGFGNFNK